MNHAQITHRFSFLRGAWVICIICRWIEHGPLVIVSGCASKADCVWVCVCVIHESVCVVDALSMRDYARDTRWPSVLMCRNWFDTAHVHVRPLKPHLHITHKQRTYHIHHGTKMLVCGTFAKRACLDALLQWFMRRACVECLRNTAPYLLVCVDSHDITVIPQQCKWYVPGSCVICQWFLPRTPRKFGQFLNQNHAQTQSVHVLWVIRAWSAVWLALNMLCVFSQAIYKLVYNDKKRHDNKFSFYFFLRFPGQWTLLQDFGTEMQFPGLSRTSGMLSHVWVKCLEIVRIQTTELWSSIFCQ